MDEGRPLLPLDTSVDLSSSSFCTASTYVARKNVELRVVQLTSADYPELMHWDLNFFVLLEPVERVRNHKALANMICDYF